MAKNPTLRDIARHADVAVSTVSQVLNNRPGVSAETRQHVLACANDLGYRHRITIQAPLSTRIETIGVITKLREGDPLNMNPFYSHILAGAERECQRQHINMMYATIDVDATNRALSLPAMLLDERVDGVIVVGAFLEKTISDISQRARHNMVLADAYTPGALEFDSVLIDNINGAMSAVTYLIGRGHRHIGLIGSNPHSYPSILERRQGYLMALAQAGITATYIEDGLLDRTDAQAAVLRLINRAPEITAIFACNDNVAIGVMNALHEVGLRVPQDISVIGFDDIDLAQEVTPPLTTIHVDKVLIGTMAVRHLKDRVLDPERTPVKTMVSTQLIERKSVGSVAV